MKKNALFYAKGKSSVKVTDKAVYFYDRRGERTKIEYSEIKGTDLDRPKTFDPSSLIIRTDREHKISVGAGFYAYDTCRLIKETIDKRCGLGAYVDGKKITYIKKRSNALIVFIGLSIFLSGAYLTFCGVLLCASLIGFIPGAGLIAAACFLFWLGAYLVNYKLRTLVCPSCGKEYAINKKDETFKCPNCNSALEMSEGYCELC